MKPATVAEIHRAICVSARCDQRDKLNFADPCAFCPNGHWGRFEIDGCDDPNRIVPEPFPPMPPPQLPSIVTMIKSAAGAIGQVISHGAKKVSAEEEARRLAICKGCEFLVNGNRCAKCGCYLNWKTVLEAWHCPIQKW